MSEFKRMPKMATSEPTVTLALKGGGPVKKAMGGGLPMAPMKAPMAPRRPSPGASMGKPMMEGNMAAKAMKQKMMKKARPGMPEAAMPAMKEGGKADMMQDKAMMKKAMKQHDSQQHKGSKGTDLKLKKGGKMAMGGSVDTAQYMPNELGHTGGVPARQGGYKKGGAVEKGDMVESGSISNKTTKMVTTKQKTGMAKYKAGGSVMPYANTMMHSAERPPQRLGKSGDVKVGTAGYKKGGSVKDMC